MIRRVILSAIAISCCSSVAYAGSTTAQDWRKSVASAVRSTLQAAELGDLSALKHQSMQLVIKTSEVASWPDDDRWTLARVYCANMAQEYANFASDKAKGTERGDVNALASWKAALEHKPLCERGLAKARR